MSLLSLQWDNDSGETVQEYDRHLGAVNTITFVDENRKFVTTSDDKSLRVWEWYVCTCLTIGLYTCTPKWTVYVIQTVVIDTVGYGKCSVHVLWLSPHVIDVRVCSQSRITPNKRLLICWFGCACKLTYNEGATPFGPITK